MRFLTTKEKILLGKIKLNSETITMTIERLEAKITMFPKITKDTAVWMIRGMIHDLNAEFEKLSLTTSSNSLIDGKQALKGGLNND